MTIAVIWILMAWMTVYIGWSDMKRKIIEAQWCASSIWWELTNYVFYALTSKSLRLSEEDVISPDFYHISLNSPSNINCSKNNAESANNTLCDSLDLSYSMWDTDPSSLYKNLSIANTCRQNQANIRFYWNVWNSADENDIKYITMNRWFSPIRLNESNVFYLERNSSLGKALTWDIVAVLCIDDDCSSWKEVSKFVVDGRTQTISLRNCGFYSADNPNKCEEREN